MDERAIRSLIRDVKADRLTRRRFVQIMVGLGLTAPMAAQMLAASGVAAQPKPASPAFAPTKRGGGGPLKVLWWQAPTLLNPYFATGTKDQDASRIFYEPLGAFDPDGNVVPILAAEVPSAATAASRATARGSSGTSRKASPGTTANPSPPTTSCSTGSTRPTPRRRRGLWPRTARSSGSTSSMRTP
jgi:peptide/nickel transport system substrate-binding protein